MDALGRIARKLWPVLLGVVFGLAIGAFCEARADGPQQSVVVILSCDDTGCLIVVEPGQDPIFVRGLPGTQPEDGAGIGH